MTNPATAKATALTIAKELGETSTDALNQIEQIVLLLGTEKTLAFLRKAQETQQQGGLRVLSLVGQKDTTGRCPEDKQDTPSSQLFRAEEDSARGRMVA